MEAPQTEYIHQNFINEPVVVIAAGFDWNQPYSCLQWGTEFGLTYPILDDITDIYSLFGVGYIPHHIVLGGDGEVLYSASGFNQTAIVNYINQGLENLDQDFDNDGIMDNEDNCVDGYNPNQADTDGDLIGDICDACNNLIWTGGDVNGDLNISLEDILLLVDIILGDNDSQCGYEAGNVNGDGVINILDVIGLVQRILGGSSQQAIQFLETLLDESTFNKLLPRLSAYPNPSNGNISIEGNGRIKIYDTTGKLILMPYINNHYTWKTNDLPSGIYFVVSEVSKIKVTLLK